ncbi:MAG: TolC family protein [Lentisphaerae bacterium]|nr:TolC family protein [Lentisphaerota bacterium]
MLPLPVTAHSSLIPRRTRIAACILAGASVLALPAMAAVSDSAAPATLTLDRALAQALEASPDLGAGMQNAAGMTARIDQAGALPNPMLRFGAMDPASSYGFPDTSEKRIEIEQRFPWFGKNGLRRDMAARTAEAAEHDAATTRRELILRVKETYYSLYITQQTLALARDELPVLEQLADTTRSRYATGTAGQADVLAAETEITLLRRRLIQLEHEEMHVWAQLAQLRNQSPDEATPAQAVSPPPEIAPPELDTLLALAAQSRPEIAAARSRREEARLARRLMQKESLPDYALGVEYRDYADARDDLMVSVGVELPIWQGRNHAAIRESEHMAAAADDMLESTEREVEHDVADAYHMLESTTHLRSLYRSALIPQAQARYAALAAGYGAGEAPFRDLLESARLVLEARVMDVMNAGETGLALARLERAVGADLASPPSRSELGREAP